MSIWWAKYGEAYTLQIPVVKRAVVDFAVSADWTPANADGAISADNGNFTDLAVAAAITGGSPTRGSAFWTLALTGLQMTAAKVAIQIIDAATKVIEDQAAVIMTWGHPSATIPMDLYPFQTPYPTSTTVTSFGSDATAHAVSMPATVEKGALLLCFFANDGTATVTTPTGWTAIDSATDGAAMRLGVYAKKADGTEGGTTVDFVTSATERAAAQVIRFAKGTWYGDDSNSFANSIAKGTAATATSTAPDAPTVTPAWGKLPCLVIAVEANDDGTVTDSVRPINYYDRTNTVSDANSAGVSLTSLLRSQWTSSENPGTWTISSQEWVAQTIAIRCAQPVALTDGANLTRILDTAVSTPATAGILDVNMKNIDNDAASASGTVTFPNATLASTVNITAAAGCAVSSIGANVITATSIAADAITAAKVADGTIDAATFAAGAITAAAIATDAIDADALAADAIAEINATVDTALADYDGPTHTELTSELGSLQTHGDSTWATATGFAEPGDEMDLIDGAITAAKLAADCITAAKVAADVHQEQIELSFTYNATADYAGADAGSLVAQIADNAGGSSLTVDSIADEIETRNLTALKVLDDIYLEGTATGGTATTIVLDSSIGPDEDVTGFRVRLTTGAKPNQERIVIACDGASPATLTIDSAWVANPVSGTGYRMYWGRQAKLNSSLQVTAASVQGNVTGNVGGNVTGTVGGMTAAGWATAFTVDTTKTYADAVAGSVVAEIADNAGGSALTEAGIADAVWDEVASGHTTNGTFGKAFTGATTVYIAGIAGTINTLDALDTAQDSQHSTTQGLVTTVDGVVDTILVDTNELQTDWTNGGRLDLIVDAILADTGTDGVIVASIANNAVTAAAIANGAIDAATFAADVDAEILSYLVDDATRIDASSLNTATVTSIPAILADTGTDGVVVNTFTTAGKAELQTEANDALVANNLDHLVLSAVATDFATTVHLDSVIGQMVQTSDGGFSRATDSLEAIRDRGDAAWITATGFSTHSAADVWAVATRVLTAGTNIQLPSNGLANVTAWTVDLTGNLSGSVGSVTSRVTANVDQIDGASWSTHTSGMAPADVRGWRGTTAPVFNTMPQCLRTGTAAGGATDSITLDAGASSTTNYYNNLSVSILSGTGSGQAARIITNYNGSTKAATIKPDWATAPDNTSVFQLWPATASLEMANGAASVGSAGYVGIDWGAVANKTAINDLGNTTISSTQIIASVSGNVGGNVTGSVGSLATQAKADVNAEADTAIADAALATAANLSTVSSNVSTLLSRLGAFTGSGVNTILGFFKALLSKAASTPSDVGGTFDASTDSTEAIRDRGDAAWTTGSGGGGSGATAVEIWEYADRTLTSGGMDEIDVGGQTLPNAVRIIGAVVAGKLSGSQTDTETFLDFAGNACVSIDVSATGNRTNVTYS